MAEYAVAEGKKVIATMGIGSCVAVCLIDKNHDLAGMAHIMLPAKENKDSKRRADILINKLQQELEEKKPLPDLKAKIFGGAHMMGESENVGKENIDSVKNILREKDIEIVEEDLGGEKGRAVWLHTENGKVVVRKAFSETKEY